MSGPERLTATFAACRDRGEAALVVYLMAGDPDVPTSEEHMRAALAHCDVLEIGVPFSDPVADGPTVQKAGVRALAAGTKVDDVLALASRLRADFPTKPIVLMTYANPVYQRTWKGFAVDAAASGVDGLILPDVPLEESHAPREALLGAGVGVVQLASPATGPRRMARLARTTDGFLYLVSSFGVTGARTEVAARTRDLVARARENAGGVPVAVGFGIATPEHARVLKDAGADGVVVGSALVGRIGEGAAPEEIGGLVAALKDGTR